jgi:hypothetical protein
MYCYQEAISRNAGFIQAEEQLKIKNSTISIAGMGGVGGFHLTAMLRLGFTKFKIADMDIFEVGNFNRQVGASISTVGQSKVETMRKMALDINPEAEIEVFDKGVNQENMEDFLSGADIYLDGLDFFAIDIRRSIFTKCNELNIPAITAAPVGWGTTYIIFSPTGMSFDDFFGMHDDLTTFQKYINFYMGLVGKNISKGSLVDAFRMDITNHKLASTASGCYAACAAISTQAVKLVLNRGDVQYAPYYNQIDFYNNRFASAKGVNAKKSIMHQLKLKIAYKKFEELGEQSFWDETFEGQNEKTLMEQVLDQARWSPSGDNSQPWSFKITGKEKCEIHFKDDQTNLLNYKGYALKLSQGVMVETIRCAASQYNCDLKWSLNAKDVWHITIQLVKSKHITKDENCDYISLRSVNRFPYKKYLLTEADKLEFEKSLPSGYGIKWHDTSESKWKNSLINMKVSAIRLVSKGLYENLQEIIDFDNRYSPNKLPSRTLGLSNFALNGFKVAMKSWAHNCVINFGLGGKIGAHLELDIIAGMNCSAHFALYRQDKKHFSDLTHLEFIEAGICLQRFWLTLARKGYVMQPSFGPIVFSNAVKIEKGFSIEPTCSKKAAKLRSAMLEFDQDSDSVFFAGRVGKPKGGNIFSRSVRLSLEKLKI